MKQRIVLLDYARAITAFLVILGHLLPSSPAGFLRVFIYQFHMPLFFMISGMLDKHIELKAFVLKNLKLVLFPVVTFSLLYIAIYTTPGGGYVYILRKSIKAFLTSDTIPINGTSWFLIALFNAKMLSYIFEKIGLIFAVVLWIVLFVVTYYFNPLFLSSTVMIMPFYMFGYCFKQEILRLSEYSCFKYFCVVGFAIVAVIMYFNGRVSTNKAWYGSGEIGIFPLRVICFYISAFSGIFAIMSISSIFKKGYSWLQLTAESLITILCIQLLFIDWANKMIYASSVVVKVIEAIVVMVACVICHMIITRYAPFMIGRFSKTKHL